MKVIEINTLTGTSQVNLTLVPRIFPNEGDTLEVNLRNELNDISKVPTNSFSYINNYFTLSIDNSDSYFKIQNKYELTIKRSETIIYQGKILCVEIGTDIQDYKHAIITNNKIQF